jgi:hypothetical protein
MLVLPLFPCAPANVDHDTAIAASETSNALCLNMFSP